MLSFDAVPVTMIVSRTVRPGFEDRFERWLHAIATEAMKFAGNLGVHVIRPSEGSREYTIIYRFQTPAQLHSWVDSDIRARRVREAEAFFEGDGHDQEFSGLETWFTLPGKPATKPPPRYKMAIVTFVAVFSLLMVIPRAAGPLLAPLPPIARMLVVCATMVSLMTYVVMPGLVRLLYRWLYLADAPTRGDPKAGVRRARTRTPA